MKSGGADGHFLQATTNVLAQSIERKRVEETLRESEERLRDLFENANDLIYSVAPAGFSSLAFKRTASNFALYILSPFVPELSKQVLSSGLVLFLLYAFR